MEGVGGERKAENIVRIDQGTILIAWSTEAFRFELMW